MAYVDHSSFKSPGQYMDRKQSFKIIYLWENLLADSFIYIWRLGAGWEQAAKSLVIFWKTTGSGFGRRLGDDGKLESYTNWLQRVLGVRLHKEWVLV